MDYLQYCWYTILQRQNDFWEQTPKYLFAQLDIHVKMNKSEDKDKKEDEVEWL
jgi:hypothetical protein